MAKLERLFTEEEKERIRLAVVRAETLSSGEIVPMVVDRSDSYSEFLLVGAILLTFLLAMSWIALRPEIAPSQLLLIEMVTFYLLFVVTRQARSLWSRLIPHSMKEKAVRRRAEEAFYAHRLHETRERTGILILVSLLERRVQILADVGINKKVPPETWENLARQITIGMKAGQNCEAICAAIDACGAILAEHFPRRPDDIDELPDVIVTEP